MNDTEATTPFEAVYDAAADGPGARLDVFWSARLAAEDISRGKIRTAIEAGLAAIDGTVCRKPGQKLRGGETLTLTLSPTPSEAVAEDGALGVLYHDEHLLILDKPPGLTIHPAPGLPDGTLVNRLLHHFPDMRRMAGHRPGIVHRLDKDTSGLLLVALTESARLALAADFAARRVSKTYLALVHGRPARPEGTIELPIGRDPKHPTRMAVVEKGGRPASSSWKLVWSAPDASASLLEVAIATGRTHQIRVHMASMGHPIVGDVVYGARQQAEWTRRGGAVARLATRQMLHAWKLSFTHPATGEAMAFRLPPPRDFWRLPLILGRRCQRVGLVGMPGCGKSTLLDHFAAAGFPIFSADAAVAQLYAPGGDGAHMLSRRYGEQALAADGSVDKIWLGRNMAESDRFRREVCELIHPLVKGELTGFTSAQAGKRAIFAEVPLLFEAGWLPGEMVDMVVGVRCDDAVRAARLAAGRGWSAELTSRMDGWQWPQDKKLAKCRFVVDNAGTAGDLASAGDRVLATLADLRRQDMRRRLAALAAAGYAPEGGEGIPRP
ncbi:dephospho-CoA kinase [Desulfovibrio sp. TomC]|uniref:dephospho-CoA kinase n=1 Tax=Desulfovibrio sp. TomC TaxID=1562888 RepID=UPI0005736E9D|nr:dephospho-CoA kinase [Desulfovibrio sp. TomC]KHK04351.1 Ribosomal large subunit pseudouridine synthase D [Desulfovibrio sp. TomC]